MKVKLLSIVTFISLFCTALFAQNNNAVVSINRNPADNTPTNIIFSPAAGLQLDNSLNVLNEYLQLTDPNIKLVESKTTNPYPGIVVKRYVQWYQDIKVAHGSFTLMANNGIIGFIHGNIFKPETKLPTTTLLSEGDALQKALEYTNAQVYMWQDAAEEKMLQDRTGNKYATHFPSATKVWVEDFSTNNTNKQLHLAYCFNVYAKQPLSRKLVYVDANTGKILLTDAIIKHIAATGKSLYSGIVPFQASFSGGSYILEDNTRGSGIYTATFNNTTATTSITDITSQSISFGTANPGIDAHWGATNVYDYWKKEHNRLSFDDLDTRLESYVNYSANYNNAFWNGVFMTYGDGSGVYNGGFDPLSSLDVCGHEIGHGVCEYTANLVYQQESGAMNEGFSDIWGETIEHYAAPNKPMWQIGSEIGRVPLRSMSNPKLYGDPDTYNGTYWIYAGPGCNMSSDYCGVHTNSGVLNKWYYLLTEGGSGTNDVSSAYVVGGIGLQKAARIAYATELALASTDNYATCRAASIAAATTMYGLCSPEVEAVTRAWYAVNVGTAYIPCGPQIGFVADDTVITMNTAAASCPSFVTLDIPIAVNAAPLGGSPVITIVDSGSAKAGVDYNVTVKTATFPSGSTSTQHILVDIYNHGAIDADKTLLLKYTLNTNGSNAVIGNVYNQYKIVIKNKNKAPQPQTADVEYTAGQSNAYTLIASPLFSAAQSARSQFIISASDLIASGVKAATPITHISFNVVDKKSTRPFTGYTIKLGHTNQTQFSGAFLTGLTTVYSNNYTSGAGWNKIPLSTTFNWDGTSNIVCEVCFANATSNSDSADKVEATTTSLNVTAYNFTFSATTGCALGYNSSRLSNSRPLVQFTQMVPATQVEKSTPANRTWDVHKGQNVYFYNNTNNKLIANLTGTSADLGCVTASVSQQGTGFTSFTLDTTVKRSVKEFTITPTTGFTGTTYTGTIYFDSSELGNMNLASVRIVKTNALVDSAMKAGNTQILVPTVTSTPTYKGFSGNFTGFSRYFIINKDYVFPTTPPPSGIVNINKSGNIRVDNNPFRDKIYITYNIGTNTNAEINLYDITGKVLYHTKQMLNSKDNHFTIDLNELVLVPGNYVLLIVTPDNILRQKVVKE